MSKGRVIAALHESVFDGTSRTSGDVRLGPKSDLKRTLSRDRRMTESDPDRTPTLVLWGDGGPHEPLSDLKQNENLPPGGNILPANAVIGWSR